MTRTRIGLALSAAVLGLSGLVGLTAGGSVAAAPAAQPSPSAPEPSAPEPTAPEPTAPEPTGSAPSAPESAPEAPHGMGMGNILHGDGTIKTKQGTKMVAMQHGTVTSVSDSSLTLKSSDGYTKTWTLGPSVHVIEHRTDLQPTSVKIGTDLVVAGPRDGTRYTASVVVVSPDKSS
jgi:hypothetical protein